MKVYWFEQTVKDVPVDDTWLSDGELVRMSAMRFLKRRTDWRLGRWTAKQAVAWQLGLPALSPSLAQIEICSSLTGAPEVRAPVATSQPSISITHRAGIAACALSGDKLAFGCDLEVVEPRDRSFISDYFTSGEQAFIESVPAGSQPTAVAVLWSAKESALKAVSLGLRMDTRCVAVDLWSAEFDCADSRGAHAERWHPLSARVRDDLSFIGWWHQKGGIVRTFASEKQTEAPAPVGQLVDQLPAHFTALR